MTLGSGADREQVVAVRNNNPMPFSPGSSTEATHLLQTLNRDWSEQLMSDCPDWDYLDSLNDWIEEAQDLLDQFSLWEES